MSRIKNVNWTKLYVEQVTIATALLIVILPYILLTNFTATKMQVLLHAVILWVLAPVFLTIGELKFRGWLSSFFPKEIQAFFLSDVLSLLIATLLMVHLFHVISGVPYRLALSPYLWAAVIPVFFAYLFIRLFQIWRRQEKEKLLLEVQKATSSWKALNAQVQPHFLFNSLNMIEHLTETNPKLARESIQNLSLIYRNILKNSKEKTITIASELETLRSYIANQKLRFDSRLNWVEDVDSRYNEAEIPANIFLNLAENAMKFGVESISSKSTIHFSIKGSSNENEILCRMINSKPPGLSEKGFGFGSEYIKEQLTFIFGDRSRYQVIETNDQYQVEIIIPFLYRSKS